MTFAQLAKHCSLLALSVTVSIGHPFSVAAQEGEQKNLVEKAKMTLDSFLGDSNMGWFRDHIKDAKGIFIVPQLLKGAFFFGAEGGSGVLHDGRR